MPLKGIGLAVLIFLSGVLGFAVVGWGGHFPLPLIPSGLAVAALYRWGPRYWPALLIGGFAIDCSLGEPWIPALGTGVGLAAGGLTTVWLLTRYRFNSDFSAVRDVVVFLLSVATGMALAPLIGSFGYWLAGVMSTPSYLSSGILWYTSTTGGVYLIAPALLAMHHRSFAQLSQHRFESMAWMLVVLATAAVIVFVPGPTGRSAIAMWSLLVVVIGTVRFGLVVSSLGGLVISGVAAASLAFGFGIFGVFEQFAGRLTLLSFTATLTTLTLTIHALLEERDAQAAERLRAERQYAQIFDGSPQPIWAHDPVTLEFLLVNTAAVQVYGWERADFAGRTVRALQVPGDLSVLQAKSPAATAHDEVHPYETRHLARDGRVIEVEVWTRSIDLGGRPAELVFAIDVTERRALGRALIDSISGEQRRIALEMHDGLGQEMTGLALSLRALATRAERERAAMASDLDQLARLSTHCIESSRRIVQGLSPLNDAGGSLEKALELLAGRSSTPQTRVRLRLHDHSPTIMEPDGLDHLYRIAQEAIQNALKHSNAGVIDVELSSDGGTVVLAVIDDGIGIPPERGRRLGFGMRTMHFRAGAIGGTLAIESQRPRGTTVRCRAPMSMSQHDLPRETRHRPLTDKD